MNQYDTGWKPQKAQLLSKQSALEFVMTISGLALIGVFVYAGLVFTFVS